MSVGRADNSASIVSSSVSTDHGIAGAYQIWYRRGFPPPARDASAAPAPSPETGPVTVLVCGREKWDLSPFLYIRPNRYELY
jgi:hypothetical protein